eukprot:1821493-Amphidinium_carterae.1
MSQNLRSQARNTCGISYSRKSSSQPTHSRKVTCHSTAMIKRMEPKGSGGFTLQYGVQWRCSNTASGTSMLQDTGTQME